MTGTAAAAEPQVRFLAPLDGARAWGEGWIEVETSLRPLGRVEIRVDGRLVGVSREAPHRLPFDFESGERSRAIRADVFAADYGSRARATIHTAPFELGEAVTIDWVEVPVRLRTSTPLSPAAFRLFENGVEQRVREVLPRRGPARFVFVIDRSLSMDDELIARALAGSREVARSFRDGDSAEVIFFNHRVSNAVPLGEADAVPSAGGTALRDALASIRPSSRTIALVISDGGDRNSFLGREEALEAVAVGNLSIHALALGGGAGAEFLRELARRTGGSFRRTTRARLETDLAAAYADLDGRWVVAYQSGNEGAGWRRIELRPVVKGVRVESARTGYYAE